MTKNCKYYDKSYKLEFKQNYVTDVVRHKVMSRKYLSTDEMVMCHLSKLEKGVFREESLVSMNV